MGKKKGKKHSFRPCSITGREGVCRFYRFIEGCRALLKINLFAKEDERVKIKRAFDETGVIPGGCGVELMRCTLALVEFPDGTVGTVEPEKVTFLDREVRTE